MPIPAQIAILLALIALVVAIAVLEKHKKSRMTKAEIREREIEDNDLMIY